MYIPSSSCGKNLWSLGNELFDREELQGTLDLPNGTYTLSFYVDMEDPSRNVADFEWLESEDTGTIIWIGSDSIVEDNRYAVQFDVTGSADARLIATRYVDRIYDIQLESGELTDYEPYEDNSLDLTMCGNGKAPYLPEVDCGCTNQIVCPVDSLLKDVYESIIYLQTRYGRGELYELCSDAIAKVEEIHAVGQNLYGCEWIV